MHYMSYVSCIVRRMLTHTTPSRAAVAAAVSGWFLAAALLVHVALSGPVEVPGLVFDRLTATLSVVVIGVSAITIAFVTRYLQDDPRLGRFQIGRASGRERV